MDGRAGGLGHGPLVPDLLSVVATPETDSDVIALGHGNGLLLGGGEFKNARVPEQRHKRRSSSDSPKVNEIEEHFLLL